MDYDATEIPVVYDRGRDHGPENLQLWMNVVSACVGKQPVTRILDLGCGTGRFTEALAAHFDTEVVGVDPSTKMLDLARKKLRERSCAIHVCNISQGPAKRYLLLTAPSI